MRKDKYEQYKTQFQIWQTTKKYSLIQPALRRVVDRMYLFGDLYGQYHCTQGNSTKAYFAQESFGAEKGLHLPPWGRLPCLQIQRPLCPSQLSTLGPQRPPPALAAASASTSSASRMDASPPSKASPQVGEWSKSTKKSSGIRAERRELTWGGGATQGTGKALRSCFWTLAKGGQVIYNEPSHRRRRILHAWGLSKAVCSNFKNTSPMAGTDRLPLSMNQNVIMVDRGFENIFSLLPIGLYIPVWPTNQASTKTQISECFILSKWWEQCQCQHIWGNGGNPSF